MKNPEEHERKLKDDWNHKHPRPCRVIVKVDESRERETRTRTEGFLIFDPPCAAIMVEGESGCYALSKVTYLGD